MDLRVPVHIAPLVERCLLGAAPSPLYAPQQALSTVVHSTVHQAYGVETDHETTLRDSSRMKPRSVL